MKLGTCCRILLVSGVLDWASGRKLRALASLIRVTTKVLQQAWLQEHCDRFDLSSFESNHRLLVFGQTS